MSSSSECDAFIYVYQVYLKQIVGSVGTFLNLISSVVFFKVVRSTNDNKNDQYKYLCLKALLDTYISLRITLRTTVTCKSCDLEKSYAIKLITVIFFDYVQYAVNLVSTLITVASSFNMLKAIELRLKLFNRIPFLAVIALMVAFCFGLYAYKLFDFTIETKTRANSTEQIYVINYGRLKEASNILNQTQSIFTDGLCQMVNILLNVLTALKVRQILNQKKKLTSLHSKKSNATSDKTQMRLIFMIMITSVIAFVCSGVNLVKFLFLETFSNSCFYCWSDFLYWLQYDFKFFVYYFFNLNFQNIVDAALSVFVCRKKSMNENGISFS